MMIGVENVEILTGILLKWSGSHNDKWSGCDVDSAKKV